MKLHVHQLRHQQGAFRLEIDLDTAGAVIGIFGNSGAGKTTLLEIVAGLRRPASGFIAADDVVLFDTAAGISLPPEKRQLGYVPQDLALFPHLSVRANLLYGRKDQGPQGPQLAHIAEVLEITPLLDRSIAALSGGQKQRAAFARALLASPRLLLMDEPLASLDLGLKLKIVPYLQRIRDEFRIPMLYVSHAPDEIAALCDTVVILRDGRCLRTGKPEELFETATTLALRADILE
jgi:molybdate transport system ATP-binding protein